MKTILIFGSSSYLGKNFANYLKTKKYNIIYDKEYKKKLKLGIFSASFLKNFNKADVIINLVGYTGKNKKKLISSNFFFVKKIIKKLNECQKKKLFIHISTAGVLNLYSQDFSSYKTTNYYEYTKLLAENYIKDNNYNFNYLIFRVGAIYDSKKSKLLENLKSSILFKKYLLIFDPNCRIYYTKTFYLFSNILKSIMAKKVNKTINIIHNDHIKYFYKKFLKLSIKPLILPKIFKKIFYLMQNINQITYFMLDSKILSYFNLFNSSKKINKLK